jgi:hypothetical protein
MWLGYRPGGRRILAIGGARAPKPRLRYKTTAARKLLNQRAHRVLWRALRYKTSSSRNRLF